MSAWGYFRVHTVRKERIMNLTTWAKAVKERDNWKCRVCGSTKI